MKIGMGLSSWSLLGAVLAALVGFGAYMYGGLATSSAAQAGVGEYVIPELEAAQPKQPSEEPSQSTKNSSLSTEAAEHALSAGDILPITNGSGSTEPSTGSALPAEAASSAPPLPVQAAGVSTLADNCTSQVWCATPAQQVPNQGNVPIQGNVPTETASSSMGDDGEDSSKKKPSKEKTKKNNKGKKK